MSPIGPGARTLAWLVSVWSVMGLASDRVWANEAGTNRARPVIPVRATIPDGKPQSSVPVPVSGLPSRDATMSALDNGVDCLIEPYATVEVATAASGIVKSVTVDRGHAVKSGQVLVQLDAEVERANVARERARVDFASKKYDRMKHLFKEQMVSEQQLEEAKSENDLAVAELRKATELLNQRTILSPLSGVVVEKYISPGELVENKKVVKLAQVHPLNVELIASVPMLGIFKSGTRMQIFPEGNASTPLEAEVKLVDRVVDAASGTFRVRLELPNPGHQVAAGVRCKAKLMQVKAKPTGDKTAAAERRKPSVAKQPPKPKQEDQASKPPAPIEAVTSDQAAGEAAKRDTNHTGAPTGVTADSRGAEQSAPASRASSGGANEQSFDKDGWPISPPEPAARRKPKANAPADGWTGWD